jgi:hypothetical protein
MKMSGFIYWSENDFDSGLTEGVIVNKMETLAVGDIITCLDMKGRCKGKWSKARVIELREDAVKVHWEDWSSKWDEWIDSVAVKDRIVKGYEDNGKGEGLYDELERYLYDELEPNVNSDGDDNDDDDDDGDDDDGDDDDGDERVRTRVCRVRDFSDKTPEEIKLIQLFDENDDDGDFFGNFFIESSMGTAGTGITMDALLAALPGTPLLAAMKKLEDVFYKNVLAETMEGVCCELVLSSEGYIRVAVC